MNDALPVQFSTTIAETTQQGNSLTIAGHIKMVYRPGEQQLR